MICNTEVNSSKLKKVSVCSSESNIFNCPGVLQLVLGYVGLGEHLFIAVVSKSWRQLYQYISRHCAGTNYCGREIICSPHTTLCSAACTSPARFIWVQRHGRPFLFKERAQLCLGRSASAETIEVAFKYTCMTPLHLSYLAKGVAESGSLAKLQWLYSRKPTMLHADISPNAAIGGSIDVLRWLGQQGLDIGSDAVLEAAAENGHLHVLRFLFEGGRPLCFWCTVIAARKCNLPMLMWLRQSGCEWDPEAALLSAARRGHVAMLAWLQQQPDVVLNQRALQVAARQGWLEACKFLHAHGVPVSSDALRLACSKGHMAVARWLLEQGAACEPHTIWRSAAVSGSVELLEFC
jgi:hypothetical protein